MNRSQKHNLGPRDLLPSAYWYRRYTYAGMGPFLIRLLVIDAGIIVALTVSLGGTSSLAWTLVQFLAFRLIFTAVYELGYLINDYFDPADAEQIQMHISNDGRWFLPFIVIRFGAAAFLAAVFFPAVAFSATTLLLAFVLAGYVLHTRIPRKFRVGSYLFLQLVTFLTPVLFFGAIFETGGRLLDYLIITAPAIVALTFTYGSGKRLLPFWTWLPQLRGRMLALHFALALPSGLLAITVSPSAGLAVIALAAVSMAVFFAFTGIGFMRALSRSFSGHTLYHTHTFYSHDARTPIGQLVGFARDNCFDRLHLTDHAEDFTQPRLERQAKAVRVANRVQNAIKVVQGLEYDMLGQHFLCLNLTRYLEVDPEDVSAVDRLKSASDTVIWAHPSPSLRKIAKDRQYRRKIGYLLWRVDGVELVNFKSIKRRGFWWKHLMIGYLGYLLSKDVFTVGSDIHLPEHIDELGQDYPRGSLDRLAQTSERARRLKRVTDLAARLDRGKPSGPPHIRGQ